MPIYLTQKEIIIIYFVEAYVNDGEPFIQYKKDGFDGIVLSDRRPYPWLHLIDLEKVRDDGNVYFNEFTSFRDSGFDLRARFTSKTPSRSMSNAFTSNLNIRLDGEKKISVDKLCLYVNENIKDIKLKTHALSLLAQSREDSSLDQPMEDNLQYYDKEGRLHKRDISLVAQAKERDHNTCVLCDEDTFEKRTFKTLDGKYIEVHHIIPLSEGGNDQINNMACLCVVCHKEAHYAPRQRREEIRNQLLRLLSICP